jgi:hypothetical protein
VSTVKRTPRKKPRIAAIGPLDPVCGSLAPVQLKPRSCCWPHAHAVRRENLAIAINA